jgi:GNAT superfamily N-acetyltransferase
MVGTCWIIGPAAAGDPDAVLALHGESMSEPAREKLRRSVEAGDCFVACDERESVLGYAAFDYSFFSCGFIRMLYVDAAHRRTGAGKELMHHCETLCRTEKLFTSTNLSNLPMQSLLAKLGYTLSGVIENLDEGDPELVYFKRVR